MTEHTRPRPQAIWLGHGRDLSFAMVHRPQRPNGRGVVVCNALGFEGLLAHRPLRHLADELADQGSTVLRLDYAGTGDSFGPSNEPADVRGLLASIHDAVELVRDQENCSTVSLVGIRIGAALACRYALDHPVDELVLWAPCDRGALYVRELKAMHRLSAAARPPQGAAMAPSGPGTALEVVGFPFPPALLDDLAGFDLSVEVDRSPAPRVLVLDRSDTAPSTALVGALRATGTSVDHQQTDGWLEFMVSDETHSEMPVEALAAMQAWMSAQAASSLAPIASLDVHRRSERRYSGPRIEVASDHAIAERSAWIGDLFALVTEPGAAVRSRRAAIVLANTGSVNRSGPGRLYVQLARRWAALGFTVIRVDLGGTGDSAAPHGASENLPYDPARTAELLATVDWTRATTDCDDVSLFGICSGAFHAFHVAVQEGDVDRLILVNPMVFHLDTVPSMRNSTARAVTAAHNVQRLAFVRRQVRVALRDPRQLAQFAARAGRGLAYLAAARARRFLGRFGIAVSAPQDLTHDLAGLADRGVTTLAIFAAAEPGARYLRAIGGLTLDRLIEQGDFTMIDIAGGDHVFSPPRARQAMADAVTDHLQTVRPALSLVGSVHEEE